jgi:enoyl-[acyl-carrier protein] reductase II
VVPGSRFAVKAADAGVDAIVAEGFEAGGHNGREETTTLVLIPMVRKMLEGRGLPLIAAGGIGSGQAMAAAFALGADGVQVGSRFAATVESSAHDAFKQRIVDTAEGGTMLSLKKVVPVRLIKNEFQQRIQEASLKGASPEELREMLGRGRAKLGMFEGNLSEGELEIGQVAGAINSIDTVEEVVQEMVTEYRDLLPGLPDGSW